MWNVIYSLRLKSWVVTLDSKVYTSVSSKLEGLKVIHRHDPEQAKDLARMFYHMEVDLSK